MRSVTLHFFIIIFLGFIGILSAQSQEVLYYCRGEEVRLRLDPTAIAIELLEGSEEAVGVELERTAAEILYWNPEVDRYALRLDSAESARQLTARKQAGVKTFPVYVPVDGGKPVWCFGEVIVCWESEIPEAVIMASFSGMDLEVINRSQFDPTVFLAAYTDDKNRDVFELASSLSREPHVLWAEPNLYGGHSLAANDPYRGNQTYLDIIHADQAWAVTTGSPDVVVAVLDEGIDLDHPDLVGSFYVNPDEIPDDGLDNDGNGFTDDVHGWDFFENDNSPLPTGSLEINAHGTAVAGLIAAVQGNEEGITGLAPDCLLLPVRVFSGSTYGGNFQTAEAIRYAANYADVINCSWSGQSPSNDLMSAIDFALSNGRQGKGCVAVFATGNGGYPVSFPASYAWTVAVGETDENDLRNEGSNFGENLTLTAPLAAWTTDNSGPGGFDSPDLDYTDQFAGTSSSTPLVSALAALLFSINPDLSGAEAVMGLLTGLDSPMTGIVPNDLFGRSPELGYGRLNAERSVLVANTSLDDRLEPNDSPGIAPTLTSGYYPWLFMNGSVDYYSLEAVAGKPLLCTVQYLSFLGDLNIYLKDESGGLMAIPTETISENNRSQTIEFTPPASGKYYLMVCPATGGKFPYTLRVKTTKPDDSYEPNQTMPQAKILIPGSGKTYQGLVLNDDDLYCVYVGEGEYIYALISFDQSQGNLGLQILDSLGGVVRSSDNLSYGEQVDPYMASIYDSYYIKVFSSTGDTNREYSLHLAVTSTPPIDGPGNDDSFEENDTPSSAKTVSTVFYPNLSLDDTDGENTDFYRFTVPDRKRPRITVGWNGLPDINLKLYPNTIQATTSTEPLAKSTFTLQDLESISIPSIPSATEYWLEVYRKNSTGQSPYRLAIEVLDPLDPCVAFFRLCEGEAGAVFQEGAIRDWRGPLSSHQAVAYNGIGGWVVGPASTSHPGSDGIALDCSGGGLYFPGNGDRGELNLGDHDFSLWARVKVQESGQRVIAGIPGVWEFLARSDNTLDFVANGTPLLNGTGPSVQSTQWQSIACVWDKTNNMVHIYASNDQDWFEKSTSTLGISLSGSGFFHLGSTLAGSAGAGWVEQVRYYDSALTSEELRRFSIMDPLSGHSQWALFD